MLRFADGGGNRERERELHDAALSRRLTQITHEKAGSVQS